MAISSLSTSSMVSGVKRRKIWDQSATTDGFFQIASTTLNTSTSTVEFTSIPSTYTHLQLRVFNKQTTAATLTSLSMWFNNDTARNYPRHEIYGDGSTITSGGVIASNNGEELLFYAGSGSQPGPAIVDILDYKNTNKYKTYRSIGGVDNNGSGYALFTSGVWLNTSAIDRITIAGNGSTFAQYSSFALYGVL